jgi:hypothetical protein
MNTLIIAVIVSLSCLEGLNNSIKYLEESGLELHNYNYSDKYLQAVVRGMKEVKFQGISVNLSFTFIPDFSCFFFLLLLL